MAKAKKVNTKFLVITIAAALALVVGIAALGVYQKLKSAERNVEQGIALTADAEAAQATGNLDREHELLEEAWGRFGRAVNKEGARRDYLEMYIDAMLRTTPKEEVTYRDRYNGDYFQALGKLASLDPTNPEPSLRFIEARYEWVREQPDSAELYDWIATTASEKLELLKRVTGPEVDKIRGYRGIAQVERMKRTSVRDEDREAALEDLKAAYASNPDFTDAGFAIADWYFAERDVQKANGRPELAEQRFTEGSEALDAFLEDHPSHVMAQLRRVDLPLIKQGTTTRVDVVKVLEAEHAKAAASVFRNVETMEPGQISSIEMQHLLGRVGDQISVEDQLALVQREAAMHPDEADWMLLVGQALQRADQRDEALAILDQVLELPSPTLSLEGLLLPGRKREAAAAITTTWLTEFANATAPEEKASTLANAKEARDALEARLGVRGQSQLKLIDGRIAMIEGRWEDAVAVLSDLRREVGQQPEVEYLLAMSLRSLGTLGDARQKLEWLVQQGYHLNATLPMLADVYLKMGDTQEALALLERAIQVDPENEILLSKKREVQTFLIYQGSDSIDTASADLDPIVETLMQIRQAEIDGEKDKAAQLVEDAYAKYPEDTRVIMRAFQMRMLNDDREGATQVIRDGLRRYPNNASLKRFEIGLQHEDPVAATEAVIEASELSEVEKALQRVALYMNYDRPEDVDTWIEAAEEADPEHPSVIEARFVWSVQQGDLAAARVAAQTAARLNSDRVEGATFEGRLLLAEGKPDEAARVFESATQRLPFNSALWRLLGQSRLEAGLINQAIDALARAMQSKPDDVASAKLYARALARLGRGGEALNIVGRNSQVYRFVARDEELRELWLGLEALYGERSEVLRVRREVLKAAPENHDNALRLAQILIEDELFGEATSVLDGLEGSDISPLITTRLRALIARGEDSLEAGNALFDQYASALQEDEPLVAARMAQAGYLIEGGEEDQAIALLESVRSRQGESLDVDRQLGNYFFNQGSELAQEASRLEAAERVDEAAAANEAAQEANERAAEAYRAVVDSGGEGTSESFGVTKRLVETLLRLDDMAGAKAVLAKATQEAPDDLEVLILSAAIAERQGDTREAQRVLGRAVEKHPSSHLPFYRRAVLNRENAAMFPDVIQDLEQVLKLRPDLMDAWAMKFDLYKNRGRLEEALAELRKGLETATGSSADTLRRVLVQQLLDVRRENEALTEAIEAANRMPESSFWQASTGDLCRRLGRHAEASRCFQLLLGMEEVQANEARHRAVSASLLDCLLQRQQPPTRGQALRLLEVVNEMDESVPIVMLQARTQSFLTDLDQMEELIMKAYDIALELGDSNMFGYWYSQMRLALGSEGEAQRWLDKMAAEESLPVALEVRRLGYKRLVEGSREEYIQQAKDLVSASSGDDAARLEALKLLSNVQYDLAEAASEAGDAEKSRTLYEGSLASALDGLAIYGDDLELNNNVGYILAKHLDRGSEAIPYAERAQSIAPDNSAVLDTVGVVFYEAGRFDEAVRLLQNAIHTALIPDHTVLSNVHLARTYIALEDGRAAQQALRDAETALQNVRTAANRAQYQKEIDEVRAELP